jgi:hypothetical protein
VPPPPDGFPHEASFALPKDEAIYLQERIQTNAQGSLIAWLSQRSTPWTPLRFPWEEPLLSSYPERLRRLVEHARCFSEVTHGAALLYNLMLAELVPIPESVERYRQDLRDWRALVAGRGADLRRWDREEFWRIVEAERHRIPVQSRLFAARWMEHAIDRVRVGSVLDTRAERELIKERERLLKRERARLFHREYLNLWGGAAGVDQLDYRWGQSQTIVNDILRGLGGTRHAHAA